MKCGEWADAVGLGVLNEDVEVVDLREELFAECSVLGADEPSRAGAQQTSQSYVGHASMIARCWAYRSLSGPASRGGEQRGLSQPIWPCVTASWGGKR
jgi:hypothetical protein